MQRSQALARALLQRTNEMKVGYHASHEQFPPSELLKCVQASEAAGFTAAMCSDHLHPWSARQGQSGFAFSWLGAALQASSLPMGTVTAPGQRYHPAVVAQAAATLLEMYPDRFWLAVGSGERLNEHVTGDPWPEKSLRNQRLLECVAVMRALWAGERVEHHGLVRVHKAQLYTRPARPPLLLAAAVSEQTARWAGSWADGLLTLAQERHTLRRVVDAFREGGGAGKPMLLQVKLSYAASEEQARNQAHDQWRSNAADSSSLADLEMPEDFEAATAHVSEADMDRYVRISADAGQHAAWLAQDRELGFDGLYLHPVGRNQREFIDCFGERVLPQLR
jgi:coenzyme F420-dependent glucose-6-phosphate dehydrogenase